MSDGFTIGAAMQTPTIFQCPHCNETIDSTADACRFCGTAVDHEAARKAAEVLARVNQACSDASYLRTAALSIGVFFVLRFLPFVSMLGAVGFIGLAFAVPIWSLRWWLKFGRIDVADEEFRKARTTVKIAGIVVSVVLVLFVVLPFILGFLRVMRPTIAQ
jgi:hypothetical protein